MWHYGVRGVSYDCYCDRQAEQRYGAAARHLRGHQNSESRSGIAVFDYCATHSAC